MSLTIRESLAIRKAMAEGDWDTVNQMLYPELPDEYGDDPNDPRRIEEEPDDDQIVRLFYEG